MIKVLKTKLKLSKFYKNKNIYRIEVINICKIEIKTLTRFYRNKNIYRIRIINICRVKKELI